MGDQARGTKRVFTGVTPTGRLTLGNYFGAIANIVRLQGEAECLLSVVDLHALTVPQDPGRLRALTMETAGLFLACGADPRVTTVFVQSRVGQHCEMAWLLGCLSSYGVLARMTQFKEKSQRGKGVSVGLFTYPALMAADILLYDTDLVPVGEDQRQHLEFTRDVAQRINGRLGPLVKVPEAKVPDRRSGGRIMRLDDPSRKMSKSEGAEGSILLLDSPDDVRSKVRAARTDSGAEVRYDEAAKPAVSNLLVIYSLCAGEPLEAVEQQYHSRSYAALKQGLCDAVVSFLAPIQRRYTELVRSGELERAVATGSEQARPVAQGTLERLQAALGLR